MCSPSIAQTKAIGAINFGMNKKELKEVAGNADGMTYSMGKIFVNILGYSYDGVPVFDENKEFKAIALRNTNGVLAAINRDYSGYNETELKTAVLNMTDLFTKKYGDPVLNLGYKLPGELEPGCRLLIAAWKGEGKITRIYETYLNAVAFPEVEIIEETYLNQTSKTQIQQDKKTIEKTENLF